MAHPLKKRAKPKIKLVKKSSGYYNEKTGERVLVAGPKRTHCKRGHRMIKANIYLDRSKPGGTVCWACRKEYDRKRGGSNVRALPREARARMLASRAFPVRQECERDGCTELGVRHHDDYDKPLEIRWLCPPHHGELHPRPY